MFGGVSPVGKAEFPVSQHGQHSPSDPSQCTWEAGIIIFFIFQIDNLRLMVVEELL